MYLCMLLNVHADMMWVNTIIAAGIYIFFKQYSKFK